MTSYQTSRQRKLKYKYKMTLGEYDHMYRLQGGKCAICQKPADAQARAMHVDHDHSCCDGERTCGECTRGLLCPSCNMGMGHLGDDIKKLQAAIEYLKNWS